MPTQACVVSFQYSVVTPSLRRSCQADWTSPGLVLECFQLKVPPAARSIRTPLAGETSCGAAGARVRPETFWYHSVHGEEPVANTRSTASRVGLRTSWTSPSWPFGAREASEAQADQDVPARVYLVQNTSPSVASWATR